MDLVAELLLLLLQELLESDHGEVHAGSHIGVLVLLHTGVQAGLMEHHAWLLVQLHAALLGRLPDGVLVSLLCELHEGLVHDGSIKVHEGLVLVDLHSKLLGQVHAGLPVAVPAADLGLHDDLLEEVHAPDLGLPDDLLEEVHALDLGLPDDLLEEVHALDLGLSDDLLLVPGPLVPS